MVSFVGILERKESGAFVLTVPDCPSVFAEADRIDDVICAAEKELNKFLQHGFSRKISQLHDIDFKYGEGKCPLYLHALRYDAEV